LNDICWNRAVVAFDLEAALADCDAAIAGAEEAGFIDRRAMVLLQLERYAEAEAAYDQALADTPDLSPSLYGRGLARLAQGKTDGAREDIRKALSLDIDASDDFLAFLSRHGDIAAEAQRQGANR
jgi:tetratricopeptide (TPR) repeat protein